MNDPGVNVITQSDINFDKLIGPIPTVANIMDTMVMIGLRCAELRPAMQQIKIDPKECDNILGNRLCTWLFYIQSARDPSEQNLEVATKQGQLYYRAIRNIKSDEELLVWYSKELADVFQVPDVEEFYDKGERKYCCPYCNDIFLFPNPLKTHLMYRCEKRLAEVHGVNTINRLQLESINRLQFDLYSTAMLPMKPHLKGFSVNSLTNNFLDVYKRVNPSGPVTGEKENNQLTLPISFNASSFITELVQTTNSAINDSHQRRKPETLSQESTKRLAKDGAIIKTRVCNQEETVDPLTTASKVTVKRCATMKPETSSHLTSCTNNQMQMTLADVQHQNNTRKEPRRSSDTDPDTGISAFKKVCKSRTVNDHVESISSSSVGYNSCGALCSPSSKSLYPIAYSLPISNENPSTTTMPITSAPISGSPLPNNWSLPIRTTSPLSKVVGQSSEPIDPLQQTRLHQEQDQSRAEGGGSGGPFSNLSLSNAFGNDSRLSESILSSYSSVKLFEEMKPIGQLSNSTAPINIANSNNIENNAESTTNSFRNTLYSDSICRFSVGLPYSKQFGTSLDNFLTKQAAPMTPMTASLLPPSLAVFAFPSQNWCAKCNASFRMTSDLVYHMRSHHKREIDPMKKRREEKLKCTICNESFRERHHLTRHMTSHQ